MGGAEAAVGGAEALAAATLWGGRTLPGRRHRSGREDDPLNKGTLWKLP